MIARIAPISCPSESILHRFRGRRKGDDWLISGFIEPVAMPLGLSGVIAKLHA
jgi:hypothetical protein